MVTEAERQIVTLSKIIAVLSLLVCLILVPETAVAAVDDDVPGVPIAPSPIQSALDSATDHRDVYAVYLSQGDVISARLAVTGAAPGFDPSLFLYPPGTPGLGSSPDWVAETPQHAFPKWFVYTVPRSGTYYLDVFQSPLTSPATSGTGVVTWSVASPVYRFYNVRGGTHFYTPSLDERNMVIARWSNVFQYEGIAYYTQPYVNPQPLYRFYNRRSASHFYTASPAEADNTIARYGHVFTYEGQTYRVATSGPASNAVYRFYNVRNGSHFFTASSTERDIVIARWSNVYAYEGVAFFIGP